jgi:hypothetical protein
LARGRVEKWNENYRQGGLSRRQVNREILAFGMRQPALIGSCCHILKRFAYFFVRVANVTHKFGGHRYRNPPDMCVRGRQFVAMLRFAPDAVPMSNAKMKR